MKTKLISVELPANLAAEIEKAAAKNGRTFDAEVAARIRSAKLLDGLVGSEPMDLAQAVAAIEERARLIVERVKAAVEPGRVSVKRAFESVAAEAGLNEYTAAETRRRLGIATRADRGSFLRTLAAARAEVAKKGAA